MFELSYENENIAGTISLRLTGMKNVLFTWLTSQANYFYPLYDEQDIIIGTQFLPVDDKEAPYLLIANPSEPDYHLKNDLVKLRYKQWFQKNDRSKSAVVVEVYIGDYLDEKCYHKFTEVQIQTILFNHSRIVLNMNPSNILNIFSEIALQSLSPF